jgi:hypothetical protein
VTGRLAAARASVAPLVSVCAPARPAGTATVVENVPDLSAATVARTRGPE